MRGMVSGCDVDAIIEYGHEAERGWMCVIEGVGITNSGVKESDEYVDPLADEAKRISDTLNGRYCEAFARASVLCLQRRGRD